MRIRIVWLTLFCLLNLSTLPAVRQAFAAPVTGHPRLWLRAEDLPRLCSWAVDTNPLYRDGLAVLAAEAKADMDAGLVPDQDTGGYGWEEYPTEMYAELFAFMSLISNDQLTRDDYAQRARALLMHVMNEAAKGAAEGEPFRAPRFSIYDRSRWWGEAFALTVDWIYPYLSVEDKATIRQVFLRWADENLHAETNTHNHPEPIGVVNDPILISDPVVVRWAANNYYTAHMRNNGLMAMSLDEADDPGNELRYYLGNATGAWLYVEDHLLRNDARGGLAPEGFEYSPQAVGYVVQFLLALHTAGQDDAVVWGPQVVLTDNPFWDDVVPALLHSLSPATVTYPDWSWMGEVYQPAWYGDGQKYWAPDFIGVFGPLGMYDYATGNVTRLEDLRWLQTHIPPGGADKLIRRVEDAEAFSEAILYFMLFDPGAPLPGDPHPSQSLRFYAPGLRHILARTSWGADATWFTYSLGWLTISHEHADGNHFEFYRQGEWLTKDRTGYGLYGNNIQTSDYHNTLALENDMPIHHDPDDYRYFHWQRGSQWLYEPSADGQILAYSFGQGYVYALGDATGLYNSDYEEVTDISHASRSIVWLEPDHIVVYDRATSKTAGRFKRFWLQLPAQAVVFDNHATVTTASGQQLFVTTLLPSDAVISSELAEMPEEAAQEPMKFRLKVEAPGGPQGVRFLHVLQGADAGASANSVALVVSTSGTPFEGGQVNTTVVLFPVNLSTPFTSLTYTVPTAIKTHLITGLTPNSGYDVVTQPVGNDVQVTINTGATYYTDSGGVLIWKTELIKGDVSGNGFVTAYDAFLVLQHVVGLIALSPAQQEAADVTGNGVISALDAAFILQYTVGLITEFPSVAKVGTKVGAPSFSPKTEEKLLADAIIELEKAPLSTEQQQVLKQLKQLLQQLAPPKQTALLPNFPNPFNPDTWIPYQLAQGASVSIRIYNMHGQLVRSINLGHRKAGNYIERAQAAYWDGRNEVGESVASGAYFYTLQAGEFRATRKMVIVK